MLIRRLRESLLHTAEGHILLASFAVVVLYLLWTAVTYFTARDQSRVLIAIAAAHLVFGRAAGMSLGYSLGYGHAVVYTANALIETAIVMLVYPLFVFTVRRLLISPLIKGHMERIYRIADERKHMFNRWGVMGIFLFILFPFWGTGAVVGSVIGFLIGLNPWKTMAVVLAATYVVCAVWAILLKELQDRLEHVSPYAGMALVLIIMLIAAAGILAETLRRRTAARRRPPAS